MLTKKSYQKLSGSEKIAPCLRVDGSNLSTSFNALVRGIGRMLSR